jgi:hypothetical protein
MEGSHVDILSAWTVSCNGGETTPIVPSAGKRYSSSLRKMEKWSDLKTFPLWKKLKKMKSLSLIANFVGVRLSHSKK